MKQPKSAPSRASPSPSTVDRMNEHSVNTKAIDELLSKELESLSFKDRNQIQEEIHGVTNLCPEETPDMMDHALKKMQQYLDSIPHKPIYDQVSPFSYINADEFRLRFLRCELYNCKKAAERFLRFTEYMAEEFDMEVLERPLKMSDLQRKHGKEALDCFKSGHSQLLPFRDRSGRRILTSSSDVSMAYDDAIRVSHTFFYAHRESQIWLSHNIL
jgi:hypothetical protein